MFISNCKRYRMKKWLLFSLLFLTSLCVHAEPLPASEVFKVSVKNRSQYLCHTMEYLAQVFFI